MQPFASEARKIGLVLGFFAALAATPPIPGQNPIPPVSKIPLDEFGLFTQPPGAPLLKRGMKIAAEANGREVIPLEFETAYLGATPVQLGGVGLRYSDERGVYEDYLADIQDNMATDFAAYPICAPIIPGLQFDARHGITDEHVWGLYTTTRLFQLAGPKSNFAEMDPYTYQSLMSLARSAPRDLARVVGGDHFFMIGEKGAKATVQAIIEQEAVVKTLKQKFAEIIGKPVAEIAF